LAKQVPSHKNRCQTARFGHSGTRLGAAYHPVKDMTE
jgi:hypothetical protein